MDQPHARRRRLRRPVRLALLTVGGILGAFLVSFLIVGLFVDLGGLVERQLREATPKIEEQLGRPVRFGRVKLKLLPSPRVEIRDVSVEAPPGQSGLWAQPLVKIGAVRVRLSLTTVLFSFGSRLTVEDLEISDVRVQVLRTADGALSYQDILDKLGTQPEKPPPTQQEIDRLGGILLRNATLADAGIYFYDLSTPVGAARPITLDHINFSGKDLQLFGVSTLTLDMAVLTGQPNLHLGLRIGPLPRDLQVSQPLSLVQHAEFSLQPIEIEPLLRFLPPSPGVGLGAAKLEAKLNLDTPAAAGQLSLSASVAARGLVLEDDASTKPQAERRGQPVDVRLETQLQAALLSGDVKLEKLQLFVNDMDVSAEAQLQNLWTAPAINKLSVNSRGFTLERLVAAVPKTALPPGAVLHGPLVVRGSASGSPTAAQVELMLDLTPATVRVPSFNKPAGTPLSVEFRGQVKGADQGVILERFGLTVGPMALLLKGQLRSAEDLDLKLDTGKVDLDRLFRLLPSVEKSVDKSGKLDGDLRVVATIKRQKDKLDVDAKITMADARVEAGDLTLRGNAELSGNVHSTEKSASIKADLDLTNAQLRVPGSVDKGHGVPMRVRAQIDRAGHTVQVRLAELTLPGGTIRVMGQVDTAKNQLDLKIPPIDLDLSRLSQVLPALRQKGGGIFDSKLRIGVSFDGNPNKLGTARASLDTFEMAVAGGQVKGSAEVVGLDEPRKVTFDLKGDRIDLDRILGKDDDSAPAAAESSERRGGAVAVPAFVRRLSMNGRVQVDSGKYKGREMRDLLLEVTMSGGKLLVKTLRSQALGGNINASGSSIDFAPARPRFALRTKLERIDVGLLTQPDANGKRFTGRGSLDLSADGNGLAWADIAPRVTGQMNLALTDGKFEQAGLAGTVVGPLLAQATQRPLPNLPGQSGAGRDLVLRDMAAQFSIANGRLQTAKPLRFSTDEGALNLSGSIGLDKTLQLNGTLDLAPQAVGKLTGGQFVPDVAIPVGLRVSGTLSQPRIEPLDPLKTVAAIVSSLLRGKGKELLQGLGNGLGRGLNQKSPNPLLQNLGNQLRPGAQPQPTTPSPGTKRPSLGDLFRR